MLLLLQLSRLLWLSLQAGSLRGSSCEARIDVDLRPLVLCGNTGEREWRVAKSCAASSIKCDQVMTALGPSQVSALAMRSNI